MVHRLMVQTSFGKGAAGIWMAEASDAFKLWTIRRIAPYCSTQTQLSIAQTLRNPCQYKRGVEGDTLADRSFPYWAFY